jgi:hypothetical protein
VTEAVRAVLEAMAHHAPVLDELVTAEWAERYARPVRLRSQPSTPSQAGVLRQSPAWDQGPLDAARRGRWTGYLVHVTETCDTFRCRSRPQ